MVNERNIAEPYLMPEPTITERLNRLEASTQEKAPTRQSKNFRLPLRGKVGKAKAKLGYATVIEISENDVIDFKREQIIDGTVKLRNTYHAVDDNDVLSYRGKPVLIIPRKSKVPYNPNRVGNNTYAQKHIMSRMMNEVLGTAKKMSIAGMSIGGIVLIGIIAYAFIGG